MNTIEKLTKDYKVHLAQCKFRKQPTELSLNQYIDMWLKDDNYKMKGKARGTKRMVRLDTNKSYSIDNINIITLKLVRTGLEEKLHKAWSSFIAQVKSYYNEENFITAEEYIALWMKDDNYKNKGQQQDGLRMARIDKAKPFTIDNVHLTSAKVIRATSPDPKPRYTKSELEVRRKASALKTKLKRKENAERVKTQK